jgi:hypothetical protein
MSIFRQPKDYPYFKKNFCRPSFGYRADGPGKNLQQHPIA